jgi:nucleoside-diphosphate-sugar epimerase
MQVLITGSNGFIGTNLYDHLHTDFLLSGLDITKAGGFPANQVYDWSNFNLLPASDTIIHLAGKAHDLKNSSDPQSYFDINTGLTKRIFDYFLESDAKKFIYFSSVKAVTDKVEGPYLTEEVTANPQTPYGQSKLQAEQYILDLSMPAGKKVYILRPCMIHGPGNKGNLNLLYKVVSKGLPWPLGVFENSRSLTSIDNLIFIIRSLLEKDIAAGIYNVADDETVSTNQIITLMAQALGKKPAIWKIPEAPVRLLARAGDLLHLPLNSERLKKLTESYVVSNEKLKAALGIERMPVSAEEGLMKTFESFGG